MDNDFESDAAETSHSNKQMDQEHPLKKHPGEEELYQDLDSIESEGDSVKKWVEEISEDPEPEENLSGKNLDDLSAKEGDLPDWINTLTQPDLEEQTIEDEREEGLETPESIRFESLDQSWETESSLHSANDKHLEEGSEELDQPEEEFIEISGYDLEADNVPDEDTPQSMQFDKEPEEIPDWLEEMIEEPEEDFSKDSKIIIDGQVFNEDEPTKPIPVEEEEIFDEPEQASEEAPVMPILSADEVNDEDIDIDEDNEYEVEESIHVIDFEEGISEEKTIVDEENSSEVALEISNFPLEEEEAPDLFIDGEDQAEPIDEENWYIPDDQPLEIPKTLRFAKYLLDQGEIEPAFEIFQTYLNKSDHLEDIKSWVSEAINQGEKTASPLWELLGDIALKQNEPDEALTAYTRAISIITNN